MSADNQLGNPCLDYEGLAAIADRHGNSYYLFYPGIFARNISEFSSAFNQIYHATVLAYALKANYLPELVRIVGDLGHWCEVVSAMEYDIARGYLPGQRLIFNGPCKGKEDLHRAISDGAILNLDSFYEIDLLLSIMADFEHVEVGLRVSFDIGLSPSRFGFNYENGEFARAVNLLESTGKVRLTSLHSHFTTRERSLTLFKRRVTGMIQAYETLGRKSDLQYLNIGGGFFGPMNDELKKSRGVDPPDFSEYATVVAGHMRDYFGDSGPCLVVEPGVSMVADCMDYVVRILDRRKTGGRDVLTVDGSINNLYSTGSRYVPTFTVVSDREKGHPECCDIAGNTCMEHDVLLSDYRLSAEPGDFIVFHNRGAYSNVYTPPFIQPAPAIVGLCGKVFASRQSYLDILSHYAR